MAKPPFWIGQKVRYDNRNATVAYICYENNAWIVTIKFAGWDPPIDVDAHLVASRREATYAKYRHTFRRAKPSK